MKGDVQDSTFETVRSIWSRQLGLQQVAAGDDFFELGGDSVAMLNVVFQVGEILGTEIAPDLMFEHRTLAEFCDCVEALRPGIGTGSEPGSLTGSL